MQSRVPEEIILVDDGSTDGTMSVAKAFTGVRYIRQERSGKAAAFNRGFSESTGELVFHLDADDYWLADKVQRVVDILERHDVGGVTHEALSVDGEGNTLISTRKKPKYDSARLSMKGVLTSHFIYGVVGPKRGRYGVPNTICARRTAIEDLLPLPKEIGLAVDGALLFGAARRGLMYLPEQLSAYRTHGANSYLAVPQSRRYQTELFRWLERKVEGVSNRERGLLRALTSEHLAHFSMLTGENPSKGAAEAFVLILRLVCLGLIPHWKHFGLPLACAFRWGRLRSVCHQARSV